MTQLDPSTDSVSTSSSEFLPRPYEQPHVRRQFDDLLKDVADVIAPVWPLKDYVAVNPYAGIAQRSFLDARSFLKTFSDCETLMPIEYYAQAFGQGQFQAADVQQAIDELQAASVAHADDLQCETICQQLESVRPDQYPSGAVDEIQAAPNVHRAMRTLSQYLGEVDGIDWTETICDEISRHCAAHYDEGQSTWKSPWQGLPLFQAWRSAAHHDRNVEVLGLRGFRKLVAELPHTPEAAIVSLLQRADIPERLWSAFLLCQAFSIPGWSAWAKYKSYWDDEVSNDQQDFVSLLAIRLAYDVALAEAFHLSVDWTSVATKESATFKASDQPSHDDAMVRLTLLRATEIAYRNRLLGNLTFDQENQPEQVEQRKLAQMVFCIDVRSERLRRQLEAASGDVETFGFAGFFGMPIEVVSLGQSHGNSHVPVLLKPQIKLHEGLHDSISDDEQVIKSSRNRIRTWRLLWKNFQTSAVSCFSFVETAGLLYGWKLLQRAVGFAKPFDDGRFDGLRKEDEARLGPTLRGLNHQGITTSAQVDLACSMLNNLGLTKNFARLVVFSGHAGCTDNNPLAAGLDCGACGGHSGEPNARLAALLLNQPFIRNALKDRGISIPEDTHFLGAVHNTTTDDLELFDLQDLPPTHASDLKELQRLTSIAGEQTRLERLPLVDSGSIEDLLRRSGDWSEVRPEWGLAGNAAFIVAPRSVTKNVDLDGRTFLHSYEEANDASGAVLELIMTAPMVVAHWINMQYYASTVDNHHFGSGNKTVHNVVGRFGILSGGGGDLMTGLPWQSVHSGKHYQHLPQRLQVVIAAQRSSIEAVLAKHGSVADLANNDWLHLIALEQGVAYRYLPDGSWQEIPVGDEAAVCEAVSN